MMPGKEKGAHMIGERGERVLVALDIGTSKVAVLVAAVQENGLLEILGLGTHPSRGLKKGVVVNIESTVQSIQAALDEAQQMAGIRIHSAYVGIAGSHIYGLNSQGVVGIHGSEVSSSDIERVLDSARAVALPSGQRVLHTLEQDYLLDHQSGVRHPLGMCGVRLEARVHVVTCAINAAQNIEKCVELCGIAVDAIVLEPLASAFAVLTEDEKELGVCLVDIGGGTSDIAIFSEGAIRHTAVIPIAGDQVTHDIAMMLRTPTADADAIKIRYGCALGKLTRAEQIIKVPSVGDRPPRELSRQTLAEAIEPRYEELFAQIQAELRRSGYEELLPGGIVLTGGTAKMEGAVELAEEVFNMPVRLGAPYGVTGLDDVVQDPIYASSVGLLQYGRQRQNGDFDCQPPQPASLQQQQTPFKGFSEQTPAGSWLARLKHWIQANL